MKLPDEIGFQDAAAVLLDGVRAYTALHYQAHLCGGDTVLIVDGATSSGSLMVQLAQSWGAKVLATYGTADERNCLESLPVPIGKFSHSVRRASFASHTSWSSAVAAVLRFQLVRWS